MAEIVYNIFEIDSNSLSRLKYIPNESLTQLTEPVLLPSTFISGEDFVELTFFTLDDVES